MSRALRVHRLRALVGPALAALPVALAWAPGAPVVSPPAGPVGFDVAAPAETGDARLIALAADGAHAVAMVNPSDTLPTRLVELGAGKPPRPIRVFPHGASHPAVGTDAQGRTVVLARTCPERSAAGKGTACRIEVTDLRTGAAVPLPGGAGARIAAMDRGAVVLARGSHLTMTPAPEGTGTTPARPEPMPPLPIDRADAPPGSVTDLDLRGDVVAMTVELQGEFGGSALLRHDAGRGWTTLGASTTGGAALGSRAYLAPQVTATGVRAFFDGAEDLPGYAARWGRAAAPRQKIRGVRLGNPVHLRSAAFLGDRLLVFSRDDECALATCRIASFGPFRLG